MDSRKRKSISVLMPMTAAIAQLRCVKADMIFMARVGDEIVVIKDVPALICDTCGEIEYTLEVSREIDVIMKEFFEGRLLATPLAAGKIVFKAQRADSTV
jgi:YgiT-type zinc finger domain-containing protein